MVIGIYVCFFGICFCLEKGEGEVGWGGMGSVGRILVWFIIKEISRIKSF